MPVGRKDVITAKKVRLSRAAIWGVGEGGSPVNINLPQNKKYINDFK